MKKFSRSRNDRMIAGVCGGIAKYFGVHSGWLRIAYLVVTIFSGFFPFGLLYLLLAIFASEE